MHQGSGFTCFDHADVAEFSQGGHRFFRDETCKGQGLLFVGEDDIDIAGDQVFQEIAVL